MPRDMDLAVMVEATLSPLLAAVKEKDARIAELEQRLTFEVLEANLSRVARWHSLERSPLEWASAMAGEAGEACNAAKKLKRIDGGLKNISEPSRWLTDRDAAARAIGLEVADTIIYGVLLCARAGVDLPACIRDAFNKKSEEYGFPERL